MQSLSLLIPRVRIVTNGLKNGNLIRSVRYYGAYKDDEETARIRQWLQAFRPDSIPRKACVVEFSRSSGPGGQNVNKVNSKATLRANLFSKEFAKAIPQPVLSRLRNSNSKYITKSGDVVIQADASRKQNDNYEECFSKLYKFIVESVDLPGQTSAEQIKKVEALKQVDNERRLAVKKLISSKKSSRRSKEDY
ncbi:hypothetical protein BJ508DRAFT_225952 [Ascobolus immersus RN42]|uniref:Prokaryotic-type class I peptide chain release factors domain-containing protein n=1 Tax=Ascobolus immersus RN42 TaxID=1160509 RepID=A0A3N4IAK8_ASCIM|nr:hypothetical protein BJ508DRAFT_225952 [Ascobolus immersus RN42]